MKNCLSKRLLLKLYKNLFNLKNKKMRQLSFLILIAITFSFTNCYDCHSCLADGENLDLPYSDGQIVTFINETKEENKYTIEIKESLPPYEYCGSLGSGSTYACDGSSSASLKKEGQALAIKTACYTYYSSVNQSVERIIFIGENKINIKKNEATTDNKNATVKSLKTIKINNKEYSDVFVYENLTNTENDCFYFVYSVKYGILKFKIRKDNSVISWIFKQKN